MKNTERKGEIARNEQFLIFLRCFYFNRVVNFPAFYPHLKMLSGKAVNLIQSIICSLTMVKNLYIQGPERVYELSRSY